ncbi:MAG TPA: ABC transporter substrate-binding protein [Pseudolabrys sp.]|jgi:ABC-type branched-subunit amino acid transport system substrate-binding protein|nr:ABC transporter substrate-binding protein [Pseudolabrys sp.]
MLKRILLGALASVALTLPLTLSAAAQDDYVVGLTGALTGPPSSTYAPAVDAMRIYLGRLNAAGGINGHKVKLILEDDGAQPSKAAANTKKLISQGNVLLMINASLSSTYAPVIAETRRAGVPLLFASGVCPTSVYPPAAALEFCTTGYAAHYDSQATLDFIKETARGAVKLGFSAMAIPLSRGEMDYAMALSKKMGMTPVDEEIIPPPTADYTSFATKLKDSGPNWVYSWAPWITQVRTLEALRKLGWSGEYIAWGHLEAERELARLKDGKFYTVNSNAMFQEALPIQKEIEAAAKKAGSKYPADTMTEGWIAGMTIEAALKAAGWPADHKKLQQAMEHLKIDTQGLRGGPIEWTKDNHFRTHLYYRIYKWDTGKSAIVRVRDWKAYDVK